MANLVVIDAAETELDEARAYYRRGSRVAADEFLAEVRRALALIADNPVLWPTYEDDDRYRFFALKNHSYVIYYRILDADTVRVVAVASSWRRPGYWGGR
jgi:plasmid stabilization system protein ParE